jgi:O-succinylbenzoate synthase
MGAHLAALLNSEYASGLATAALLTQDVTDTPLIPVDGEIVVERIELDEKSVSMHLADEPKTSWWMNRLKSVL